MYDLNLNIPNITSDKYSNERRFLMLKNYLYELNETLSFALAGKVSIEDTLSPENQDNENTNM